MKQLTIGIWNRQPTDGFHKPLSFVFVLFQPRIPSLVRQDWHDYLKSSRWIPTLLPVPEYVRLIIGSKEHRWHSHLMRRVSFGQVIAYGVPQLSNSEHSGGR